MSLNINFEKLKKFLNENRNNLIDVLRSERYEMMRLSVEYLTNKNKMKEIDIGRLDALIGEYRRSSLRHYIVKNLDSSALSPTYSKIRTEFLI